MKYNFLWFCLVFTGLNLSGQTAPEIVAQCIEAHGGKDNIMALQYVKTTYIQHINMVEQSERPTGPYIHDYQFGTKITDIKQQRSQLIGKLSGPVYGTPNWLEIEYCYADEVLARGFNGRWIPMNAQLMDYKEQLYYSPEQVLLHLVNASAIKLEGKQTLQGVDNWKVNVQTKDDNFTVFINYYTNMITAVEYESAYTPEEYFFWSFWGDYKTQIYYSSYNIFSPGILYPMQTDVIKNGWDYRSTTITSLEFNSLASDTIFNIPEEVKQLAATQAKAGNTRLTWSATQKEEVAPGINLYKGAWNVTFVEQKDGIVIIEAPISSDYCEQAIQAARQQFPDKPIKAVITTSDAWPHLAGLRQYAAEKIPIYALDLNQFIIDKLLNSNFKTHPDAFAKTPQKPSIHWVNQKNIIKDEQLPIEIYPIRGEGGERMLMVYFPKQQILYASDLVQKNARTGEFFMPGYLVEVKNAAKREGLSVKKVFAMHTAPIDWSEMTDAIEASKK